MIEELRTIEEQIFNQLDLSVSNLQADLECEEYAGYNFKLNNYNIKFRKAKVTPKKRGKFVTLWKRNPDQETEPFDIKDNFDFYIIACKEKENFGIFIFPKQILHVKQILSDPFRKGKRGFRVYTNWDFPEGKQALKSKEWQAEYFINLGTNKNLELEIFNKHFNSTF